MGKRRSPNVPAGGMIPDEIRPGTAWGMMCGFSGEVTPCVLFGGLPGLELQERERGGSAFGCPFIKHRTTERERVRE